MAADPVLDMLLRDVIVHPDQDGYRLVFADRCEDLGDDDRAEFIRLGLGLERLRREPGEGRAAFACGGGWFTDARAGGLLASLDALLGRDGEDGVRNDVAWSRDVREAARMPTCGFFDLRDVPEGCLGVNFRGGFVGEAALPLDAWRRHGPALVRAAPLELVRLTDRTPNQTGGVRRPYYWWHGDLPAGVYRLMACDDAQPAAPRERPNWKRYPGPAAAESAASDALLAWARAAAPEAVAP